MGAVEEIQYSEKYHDETYEYRHVILPAELAKLVPRTHLLSETEWRNLGVQQSPGWVHYMHHPPEPHILLFRRVIVPAPTNNIVNCQGTNIARAPGNGGIGVN